MLKVSGVEFNFIFIKSIIVELTVSCSVTENGTAFLFTDMVDIGL